ncbi:MAG: RagB/SusD family nutrient uptake outer membrane protein [Prevotella sp.]|nr:RagB/SusD family nutrient uptake outer membrane protein [Prevotella sp.]
MNIKNIKYVAAAMLLTVGMTSCGDFLDRPVEDNYNTENYYTDDASCVRGVNYLYNSPWYDFQRAFIKIGEVMSGNMYWGSSPYMNFSLNGTDQDLVNMSYSLWAEIGHANTVYNSIKAASCSESVRNQCMGECLAWKAMAYFYLVRTFGDVPIVHDNSVNLAAGDYNDLHKVQKADVYEYILMTLEKAMELLPREKSTTGRIDYYCAEGLYAKVLLTAAGVTGQLNSDYLQRASAASLDVIQNSGRKLMENYEDIFRGSNNVSDESLIAWRWTNGAQWTSQNTLQSDLMPEGFDENGDCWGGWGGPSADLQDAFGYDVTENPSKRIDTDVRRKATMMGAGDVYSYFWRDKDLGNGKTGFDILKFYYDKSYNPAATGEFQGPCGVQNVKHAYGDNFDHQAEMNASAGRMAYNLATHILRLSDVYLVHAEAEVLQGKTSSRTALDAFNAVRGRAISSAVPKTTLTFDDIWKERRLEFAGEGDRWYDFVRRAYYDVNSCINELKAQRRNAIWNCGTAYKTWFESGYVTWDPSEIQYDEETPAPNVTANSFTLPYPTEDVALNPNLGSNVEPDHVDVRATYSY